MTAQDHAARHWDKAHNRVINSVFAEWIEKNPCGDIFRIVVIRGSPDIGPVIYDPEGDPDILLYATPGSRRKDALKLAMDDMERRSGQ